jgi:hypothetical protein
MRARPGHEWDLEHRGKAGRRGPSQGPVPTQESEPRPRRNNRWYLAGPGFMLTPSLEGLQATELWGTAHPHSHHPWRRVKRHEVLTSDRSQPPSGSACGGLSRRRLQSPRVAARVEFSTGGPTWRVASAQPAGAVREPSCTRRRPWDPGRELTVPAACSSSRFAGESPRVPVKAKAYRAPKRPRRARVNAATVNKRTSATKTTGSVPVAARPAMLAAISMNTAAMRLLRRRAGRWTRHEQPLEQP